MKEKHSSHRKAKGNDKINCVREKRNEMEKKRREEKRRKDHQSAPSEKGSL